MIGRTNTGGGGGGGGGLNFRVIGGTSAPSNPKENDIWVNTDVKIPGWAFSAEDPSPKVTVEFAISEYELYLTETGSKQYHPNSNITDYVKLPDGTREITTINSATETANFCHAFYDANKTLLATAERKANNTTYALPTGAVYVRFSAFYNDPLSFVATAGRENGFVWVLIGADSPAKFNALKKNTITVYPILAKQYSSGALIDVPAKIYKNGAWMDWWNGELYTPGNMFDGWHEVKMALNSNNMNYGTLTIEENGSTLKITQNTDYGANAYVYNKKLDLSKYNTLVFDGSFSALAGITGQSCSINIWTELGAYESTNRVASINYTSGSKTIDVSGINEECYIGVFLWHNGSSVDITSLKLE